MFQFRNVRGLRNAFRQHGFMDQRLRAAIVEHIGNLGFLLARTQQHRDQPRMRRAGNNASTNLIRLP